MEDFFSSELPAFLSVCLRTVESRAPEAVAALNAINAVLYPVLLSLSSTATVTVTVAVQPRAGAVPMCPTSIPHGLLGEVRKLVPRVARLSSGVVSEWCGSCDARDGSDGVGRAGDLVMSALGACALVAACAAVGGDWPAPAAARAGTGTRTEAGPGPRAMYLFDAASVRCLCEVVLRSACARARQLALEALACITVAAVSDSPYYPAAVHDAQEDASTAGITADSTAVNTVGNMGIVLCSRATPGVASSFAAIAPLAAEDADSRCLLQLVRAAGRAGAFAGDNDGECEAGAGCLWGALEGLAGRVYMKTAGDVGGVGACDFAADNERSDWEEMLLEEWLVCPLATRPIPHSSGGGNCGTS